MRGLEHMETESTTPAAVLLMLVGICKPIGFPLIDCKVL